MNFDEDGTITQEALQSGMILQIMKNSFIQNRTEEKLMALLSCLRDSQVFVPMHMYVSEEDEKKLSNVKTGDHIQAQDEVRLVPDIMEGDDGGKYIPIFSSVKEMPDEYKAQFTTAHFAMLRCIEMAHATKNLEGLVLDPFTDPFVVSYDIADIIPELPSRLVKKEDRGGENHE